MWRSKVVGKFILGLALVGAAACHGPEVGGGSQALEEGTLPGGSPMSVDITSPADGAVFSVGDPIPVTGTAGVIPLEPEPDTALVIVLDVSGSTSQLGCTGDANGDGVDGTILDCEIQAALALVEAAADAQTVGEIGIVVFASTAAIADVGPGPGVQLLTAPDADENSNGIADLEEVLRSAFSNLPAGGVTQFAPQSVGNLTGYGNAVERAFDVIAASTMPNQLVSFMSDGFNNQPPSVAAAFAGAPAGPVFHTFAVGAGATCVNPNPLGDLEEIATTSGGNCTDVPDPADLPGILPTLVVANLNGVVVELSGGDVVGTIALPTATNPPLPGPKEVTFSADASGHGPGLYSICATATGQDVGAPMELTDCIQIRINAPPIAVCEPREVSADAACQGFAEVDDGSFDPDGDAFTCEQTPPGPYPLGDTAATLTCTDAIGDSGTCDAIVSVIDTTPPEVIVGEPIALWSPDHKYHSLSLSDCVASVADNCDALDVDSAGVITRITSDEPENGAADGNTCDDAVITGDATADLRAERSGQGDGRVYRVHFTVTDAAGNATDSSCEVHVVHDQSPASTPAVDSGCGWCVGDACGLCPTSSPGC